MQMLHVFHEIHNGGLGSRIQGQDGIDDVLGGVVQGHIAAQDFRRAAVLRAPQQLIRRHMKKFRQSAQRVQIRSMYAVLVVGDGSHRKVQKRGQFLLAQTFFLS